MDLNAKCNSRQLKFPRLAGHLSSHATLFAITFRDQHIVAYNDKC